MSTDENTNTRQGHENNGPREWVGWAVIALTVLMVLQVASVEYRDRMRSQERGALIQCLTQWAADFQKVVEIRSGTDLNPPWPPAPSFCLDKE